MYFQFIFQNLTEKTRKLVSPSQEKELQLTNSNLTEELQKSKYQATHLEQINKTLREEKLDAQKKKDQLAEQNKNLTQSIEVSQVSWSIFPQDLTFWTMFVLIL